MKKNSSQAAYKKTLAELEQFEKDAAAYRKELDAARDFGDRYLTRELLKEHLASGTELSLAYGRQGLRLNFTIDDLRRFAKAKENAEEHFLRTRNGVPLLLLEKSSLPADMQRSYLVKSALLYKIDKNILYFQVTGNVHPYYQVQIRLSPCHSMSWSALVRSVLCN